MSDTISLTDLLSPDETEDDVVRGAVAELSAVFGWPYEDTWAAVRQRAAGERDPQSLAMAAAQLCTDALGEGQEPGQHLALTDYSQEERDQLASEGKALPSGAFPIKNAEDLHNAATLWASGHGQDRDAAERLIRKRAKELGVSLEDLPGFGSGDSDNDGDEGEDVAASYYEGPGYQAGHYVGLSAGYPAEPAGGPGEGGGWPARRAAAAYATQDAVSQQADVDVIGLVSRNPRLGQFFRHDLVALAAGDAAGGYVRFGAVDELAGDSDYQSVEDAHTGSEVERLSMANDERNGRLPKGISSIHDSDMPRGGKRPHGSRHTRWCSSACSRDHSAPSDGGVMHPEVSRYLDMAAAKMGNAERPHGSNVRHAPMSAAELHRARAAARPGHT